MLNPPTPVNEYYANREESAAKRAASAEFNRKVKHRAAELQFAHIQQELAKEQAAREAARERSQQWRADNPEKATQDSRRRASSYYHAHKAEILAKRKAERAARSEHKRRVERMLRQIALGYLDIFS